MWANGDVPPEYRVWRREDGSPWQLGRGRAYKATDLRTDGLVTLRFFDAPAKDAADQAALARLAHTLARPGSAHLNALRDLFIRDGAHLAVTEFIEGPTLAEGIAEHGKPSSEAVLALARETLEALDSLHRAGVAHGSVGPAKLLFAPPDDTLSIVDGGLHPGATRAAPPEGNAATADDLRRLGITLWFALTGTLPFAEGLTAPPGAAPDWKPLDALPASASGRALLALFTRTLNPGGGTRRPRNAAELLAGLEQQGFQPPDSRARAARGRVEKTPGTKDASEDGRGTSPTPGSAARLAELMLSSETSPATPRRTAGVFAVGALAAGLVAAWVIHGPGSERREQTEQAAATAASMATPAAAGEPIGASSPNETAYPALTGGPPVSANGIEARAARMRDAQPGTLEALKNARELRRAATLAVADGRGFPTGEEVARVKEALSRMAEDPNQKQRTMLVLVLGYSDQPTTAGGDTESQEEADALAAALFHEGIVAPVYACGLGAADGMVEVDAPAAGGGGFVEVWVAFLLF